MKHFTILLAALFLVLSCAGGKTGAPPAEHSHNVSENGAQSYRPVEKFAPLKAQCQLTTYSVAEGKVVGVTDGDTVTLLLHENGDYRTVKVRLLHIDAPEKRMDFGAKAKAHLAELLYGRKVRVRYAGKDRYGRILGEIYVDGVNINKKQVADGMAWVYRVYCNGRDYLCLEAEAREAYLGLWSKPDPIPPWEYRRNKAASETYDFSYIYAGESSAHVCAAEAKPLQDEGPYMCGTRRFCKEMDSCEEAYYFYEVCGLKSIDGDKDGIPCESLCR